MEHTKHSPGPWNVARMTSADTGKIMTPEELGEYVKNAVIKSAEESGTTDFLFVWVEDADGKTLDVCHVGNGTRSPFNAKLIAAAPDLLGTLSRLLAVLEKIRLPAQFNNPVADEYVEAADAARKAIAKATEGA